MHTLSTLGRDRLNNIVQVTQQSILSGTPIFYFFGAGFAGAGAACFDAGAGAGAACGFGAG